MKKEKGTFGWIFRFAGQKKSGYIASVLLAVIGAAFQIPPFVVMAKVIGRLLSENKDLPGYLIDCAVMAVFWLLRVLFLRSPQRSPTRRLSPYLAISASRGLPSLPGCRWETYRQKAPAS